MTANFPRAMETADPALLSTSLAPDVVFRSPTVHTPMVGRETLVPVLLAVWETFEDFRYTDRVESDSRTVLFFSARIGDRDLEGVDAIRVDPDGRVKELIVMIRPLSALTLVKEQVVCRVAANQAQQ